MNHFNRKTIAAVTLACAGLLASSSTLAGVISYDFTVTIDTTTSPLFNQVFNGSFSYDDAQMPAPGFGGEDLYALQDFAFDFAGSSYSMADLFYGDAAVMGGVFLGLDAAGSTFAFMPAITPFAASFAYDFGAGDFGNGSLVFTPAEEAPEPESVLLLSTALLAMRKLQTRRNA